MGTADRSRTPARSSAARTLRPALGLVALVGVALAAVEVALFVVGEVEPLWAFLAFTAVALGYLAAGLLAWWRGGAGPATAPARCCA